MLLVGYFTALKKGQPRRWQNMVVRPPMYHNNILPKNNESDLFRRLTHLVFLLSTQVSLNGCIAWESNLYAPSSAMRILKKVPVWICRLTDIENEFQVWGLSIDI